MTKEQIQFVCDFSHDVIMKLKQTLGIKPREESLLCHSLWHLNTSNWVERITANGIISRYIVKS